MEVKTTVFIRKSGKAKGKWTARLQYYDSTAGKTKQLSGKCQNAPMRLTNATDRAFTEKMNAVHAEAIPDVSESEFVN